MCEPLIRARTGLSVAAHQERTVDNFLRLRALAPDLPIAPVVQGWTPFEYVRHAEQYAARGVDLRREPRVGVGTVCRRQGMAVAGQIVALLASDGLRLHGFGVKKTGLRAFGAGLVSSDTLAWSYAARRNPPLAGCVGRHINCANCPTYALEWRADLVASMEGSWNQASCS
jgi:hypothetical protein